MRGPRCNLPVERHDEILGLFDGGLSEDEEREIRDMFPQYLFFRNEYPDDGMEASSTPIRVCTCTACGETFEAVRGNYKRGKLHGEPCNCPNCGRRVEGRAVYKYKYEMSSLCQWLYTAVLRVTGDGALLITAGTAKRSFTWDELTGTIDWYPLRRYYIARETDCHANAAAPTQNDAGGGPMRASAPTKKAAERGVAQCWKAEVTAEAWSEAYHMGARCTWYEARKIWTPMKTVTDAFAPNYEYNGAYVVIGLGEALGHPAWKYCQIADFYRYQYAADIVGGGVYPTSPGGVPWSSGGKGAKSWQEVRDRIDDRGEARWIVQYLAWYALHPQMEMAVKLGLEDAVRELIEDGKKNARLLNWNARKPADFLRLPPEDAKAFLKKEFQLGDLRRWKEQAPELPMREYAALVERIGKNYVARLALCAAEAGCGLPAAVRYVEKLRPDCARFAPPMSEIIQTWLDYLHMARRLGYDMGEETVVMPKDLKERHDAAAETERLTASVAELKRYKKRRKQLEQTFDFKLGGLRALVPLSSAEIVQEGKTLHHCVGGYAARHVEGATTILFIRKARTPMRSFLTVELYQERGTWKIRQVHGYRNEGYAVGKEREAVRPSTRYAWFLDAWLGWVNAGSPRDRDGKPVLPDEKNENGKEQTA